METKLSEGIAGFLQSDAPDSSDEKALLTRLKSGDQAAFEMLYDKYKYRITKNLLKLLKSEELAEDVLQDLFIKVWDIRTSLDTEKSFRSYLFRIAENMVMDYYRRTSRDKKLQETLMIPASGIYSHIEENIFTRESQQILHAAIDLLPPKRKRVFILCKLDGKSYNEVSELLGISHSTINDHLYKANIFLKNYFKAGSDNIPLLIVALVLFGI